MGWLGGGLPVVAMLALNVVAAVLVSLVKVAMDGGLNPLVLVTLQQLTAALFLGPIAYFKERKSRPKLTLEIFAYLFVSAALGAALRQYMIFVALRYTTATFVTAFSNIAPVLTFLLAILTRSESLNLRTKAGIAKLVGTLISLAGAMVLTFYKGVPVTHASEIHSSQLHHGAGAATSSRNWTLGTVAILGNCICLSCWFLLHSRLAKKYPYVYSCNAFMCMFSFLQVAVVGLCTQRNVAVWTVTSKFQILTVLYAGVVGCGLSFVLLTWCIEKRGPVFVAAFIPVVQIIVSVIDFTVLHEQFFLGSVLGSVLVIGGLYLLLWGKRQETLHLPPKVAEHDKEQQQQQQVQL
ncbi:WAT1-related protein At4g01440-like [Oryza brachyantha]|uniref:WAT1-related protein At4g01440-like n=1 Tax=Oryza brachyantha TaxID=4533 RepID=UPI0003EA9D4B|nr:WAT1-related protein At4g01440-like [Oryza brachyantha]